MEENQNEEYLKKISIKMDTFLHSMEENNNIFKEKIKLLNDNILTKFDSINERINNLENKIKKIEDKKLYKEDKIEAEIKQINNDKDDRKNSKDDKEKKLHNSSDNKKKRGPYKNKNNKNEFLKSIQYLQIKNNREIWKYSLSSYNSKSKTGYYYCSDTGCCGKGLYKFNIDKCTEFLKIKDNLEEFVTTKEHNLAYDKHNYIIKIIK